MEYGPPPLFRQGISARIRFFFFVLVSVILILIDGRLRHLDNFRSAVVGFTTPLVQLVTAPFETIRQSEEYFISKVRLKRTNDELAEENRRLSLEVARLNEMQEENHRLRELIHAVPRTANKVVTAEVLGRVADQFTRRLHINLGERDGLKVGMPVIGSTGVLGQISRVISQQAEVTLITDHRQKISVSNQRTGERFILAGTGENVMDLLFVLPTTDIQVGDKLVTSGLDKLFPREISTGTVNAIDYKPGETYRNVTVEPTMKIDDILFATVILTDPDRTAELEETQPQSSKRRRAGR